MRCTSGEYRIDIDEPGRPVIGQRRLEIAVASVRLEAEALTSTAPRELDRSIAYGLVCLDEGGDDGYVFLVDRAGAGVIGTYEEGQPGFRRLVERDGVVATDALRVPVTLRAECLGRSSGATSLVFAANGRVMLTAEDPGGERDFERVGFYAFSAEEPLTFNFDDVSVDQGS